MSNLLKRILVGVIGIPLILFVSYSGGIYFLIFSIIISTLALLEFWSMFEKKSLAPLKYTAVIFSTALLICAYFSEKNIFTAFFLVIILAMSSEIFRRDKSNPLNPVLAIFGIIYITIPFIMLNILVRQTAFNIVICIFILIWSCDTVAYFSGRLYGKRRLSLISPNKTWEGAFSGFVFTVIISLVIHYIFPEQFILRDALVLGIITGIFSQIGDLFESLIKRYCLTKDSSDLIPGHGGILDRFDSLIFISPLVFIYFIYIK